MKYVVLEKAEKVGIKISGGNFPIWIGITEDEIQRLFLAGFRHSFPEATMKDVGKYYTFSKVRVKPTDKIVDVSKQRVIWKPRLDVLDKIKKSEVKPFTRVRMGKMERVKGYTRAGVRKAIFIGLIAIMVSVFGVSPLMAQTKYAGEGTSSRPYTNLDPEVVEVIKEPTKKEAELQKLKGEIRKLKEKLDDSKKQKDEYEYQRENLKRNYNRMMDALEESKEAYQKKYQKLSEQYERHKGPGGASQIKDINNDIKKLNEDFRKEQKEIRNMYGYR